MQSAARITDLHACADSGPNAGATLQIIQGSPNILINGLPAARMGDPVSCRLASGPPPTIAQGSSTVSFNGKPAARMGDKISNGGSINLGSGNVFIGDGGAIISIGDGVNVSFGDGCMVYLSCDPPGDQSKSTRNSALSDISSNAQAIIAALDADMENLSTAIKADAEELYIHEKSEVDNFANDDLDDQFHDALDPLGPAGAEISASAEGLGELGAAIVSGLKLLNSAKAVGAEKGPTAGDAKIQQCSPPKPKGIPEDWIKKSTNKNEGDAYINPKNPHERVRVMPGNPQSSNPAQQNPYVINMKNGKALDVNGNPVNPKSEEAHIPYDDFEF